MKKAVIFFIALVMSAALAQEAGAQKRVIKVQGHPHELLTAKHGGKGDAAGTQVRTDGNIANIDISSVQCWANGRIIPGYPVDSAVLAIKWTDGKAAEIVGDSILIWGYRWTRYTIYNDPTYGPDTTWLTKYTIDMIRAIANADCHFNALLENTSGGNFVVGGFGYNFADDERVPLTFDSIGAQADTANIKFHYTGTPNCSVGQGAVPYDAPQQAKMAIKKASEPNPQGTGIISDPFNADYSYPAYDFDYWKLTAPTNLNFEWQSGWYHNGYWGFYSRNSLSGDFTSSLLSINQRVLSNGCTDGFVFQNLTTYPPLYNMSGDYTSRVCDCGCNATAKNSSVKKK